MNLDMKKNSNSSMGYIYKSKSNPKYKGVLFGDSTLGKVKQILSENYNIEERI